MPEDETAPPFPETPPTVQTKTETTETFSGTPRDTGSILGMSGRFWITLTLVMGMVAIVVINALTGKAPEANLMAGFLSTASLAVGVYLGQAKPKTQP